MTLLAILIVVALLQFWGSGGPIQRDDWFTAWRRMLIDNVSLVPGSGPHLMMSVLVPVAAVLLLEATAKHSLWGALDLLLAVVVLLYSLGRGNVSDDVADYLRRWESGDTEAILDSLCELGEEPPPVSSAAEIHREARKRLYARGFERLFAVLFWFAVFGPAGALLYRLLRLYPGPGGTGLREQLLHLLNWIPCRLTAAGFSIIGDFDRSSRALLPLVWQLDVGSDTVLERCGNAALGIELDDVVTTATATVDEEAVRLRARHQMEAVELLFRRSLLLWLVAIGIMVIAL